MTFAVINWLNISINLLLVLFVIICVLMTLIILMQRPKQEGLGAAFGGGVTDQVFGARTTNVLQRGTVYLGSLFFIFALLLAVLIGQKNKTFSTVTKADIAAKAEAAKIAAKPTAPVVTPALSEQLPATAPVVPVTPVPVEVPAVAPAEITPTAPADPTPAVIPAVPATGTPEDKPKEP
jgi:preprotein translocase subunit SecG